MEIKPTEIEALEARLRRLSRQVRWLVLYAMLSLPLFVVLTFTAYRVNTGHAGVLRARGLVIEDSAGRDRILLGAPIPFSADRVRTDTHRVRRHWARTYAAASAYMQWYQNYRHGAYGMVVMNEDGFDRVLVGDRLADPNIGRRMFEMAGVVWNDAKGWELGGLGVNTTADGKSRSVVGVDGSDGEAVHLVSLEDGTRGIIIGGQDGRLLIGKSPREGRFFRNKEPFTGFLHFDSSGKVNWRQGIPGRP